MKSRFIHATVLGLAMLACLMGARPGRSDDAPDGRSLFSIHKGLVYSRPDDDLKMDLYLPQESAKSVRCVLVIQGGGFLPQDGQRFRAFAAYLAEHGFAAALIAYRGRPDNRYRDTIADVKAAIRFVREVSGKYKIDPNRIGVMGRSAGGTLAALAAVTGDVEELEGNGGRPEYSSRIQAAVCYAGVFDFVSRFSDPRQIAMQPKVKAKIESNGQWIGVPFSEKSEEWRKASAVNHVDAKDPPVLFMHCKDDATVPWLQSQEMYEAMVRSGVAAEVKYYDTGGHGFKGLGEEPMAEMVRFFEKILPDPSH